jgi:hypothetical protein
MWHTHREPWFGVECYGYWMALAGGRAVWCGNLSGKPTFIEPLTSIIYLNLTLFMQYGLGNRCQQEQLIRPDHFTSDQRSKLRQLPHNF